MRLAAWLVTLASATAAHAGNLELRSVAWSPDGKTVAVGAFQQTIVIDADTRKELLRVGESKAWHEVSFLPDGGLVTQGGDSDTAGATWRSIVWEARTGVRRSVVAAPSACATDTEVFWGCRADGTGWRGRYQSWKQELVVERWDGKALSAGWTAKPAGSLYRQRTAISSGGVAALAGKEAYSAVQTERMIAHHELPSGGGHGSYWKEVPKLVSGGFIRIHDSRGNFRCEKLALGREIVGVQWAPNGRLIAGDASGTVFVLAADCTLVHTLAGLTGAVVGVAARSDRVVAVSRTGEVGWWDLASGAAIATTAIR